MAFVIFCHGTKFEWCSIIDITTSSSFFRLSIPYEYAVVDQFENPRSYYFHLKDASFKVYNITFLTKAEDQCLSVACASLISRYIFLREMDKISKDLGMVLPKGAGDIVNTVGMDIVKKYGKNKLPEIAKMNFKNVEKII